VRKARKSNIFHDDNVKVNGYINDSREIFNNSHCRTLLVGTMTRVNPVYNASSDAGSAILRFDDKPAEYANGTVTIGIRLSSNLRGE
jgi:hypothetical protein